MARPARYVGGELNSIRKAAEGAIIRVALAFPDIYEVGMSNLGLRILYHVLNSIDDVAAERVFAPAPDMEAEMRREHIPLFSLESVLPVKDFDLVGFSLAYELGYTTVLNMLDLAGIALRSGDRSDGDPIVIAGGHCATNPEPMAEFIDAFVIGDGEDVVVELIDAFRSNRGSRAAALRAF
ncbi:MAG: B12-binding domain-containing radical SAM protein, partial [Armatimonadota bacterium]